MTVLELVLLAFGLSMDACAVAMTNGMCHKDLKRGRIFQTAACFGLMQGIMPLLGYLAGTVFADIISAFDHLIALILLGFIGVKMIVEAFLCQDETENEPFTAKLMLLQGLATSIDALAVGVSFVAMRDISVLPACGIICGVTFCMSLCGIWLGTQFGNILNKKTQIIGGLILVLMGLRIFMEHIWLS